MARVVVTGATGNVGSAVVRALVADGVEVVGLSRRPPTGGAPDGWEWRPADLTAGGPALVEVLRGADAVVHLAWGFQPSHDIDYLEELGVGGTRRVLDAIAATGVPHLVHQSSIGAYAPRTSLDPVDESWPTTGVPSSPYSRHKVAAERLLDRFSREHPDVVVTRTRPGIIGQRSAASGQLRYFIPSLVPRRVVGALPVVPLDREIVVPVVHADDVAEAIRLAIAARAGGAFNLAAEPLLHAADIAHAIGHRHVHAPAAALRALASLSWHARLQPVDPGWVDLAAQVPVLDTGRARRELGWTPATSATATLAEVVDGMRDGAGDATDPLRPRTIRDGLRRAVAQGPVHRRTQP